MTLNLELPEETLTALRADAQAQGRRAEEVAAEYLAVLYSPEDDLETALEEGFAQAEAGPGQSFDEFAANLRTQFEARYGADKAA